MDIVVTFVLNIFNLALRHKGARRHRTMQCLRLILGLQYYLVITTLIQYRCSRMGSKGPNSLPQRGFIWGNPSYSSLMVFLRLFRSPKTTPNGPTGDFSCRCWRFFVFVLPPWGVPACASRCSRAFARAVLLWLTWTLPAWATCQIRKVLCKPLKLHGHSFTA